MSNTSQDQQLLDYQLKLGQALRSIAAIDTIDVAPTPRTLIYQQDKLRLYHYKGKAVTSGQPPLLICYALVNRPYILDLDSERSFIAHLLQHRSDIYLIDWGYPDALDYALDLDDYINDYLDHCVEATQTHCDHDSVDLLGICQGGTLSLCYTALHPKKIRKLITMVTPVDFNTSDNLLSHLAEKIDISALSRAYGNIPGQILNGLFSSLMPARLGIHKAIQAPARMQTPQQALSYLRMERWINDCPDQAGMAFEQFIRTFFQQNGFINDCVSIGEERACLKQITQPLLNIFASQDHLVPPSASRPLKELSGSADYTEIEVNSGHIGLFVSGKVNQQLCQQIDHWLKS
ncbi:class III poly(R)-hydroxyalkanoic acid synthase subunit PhaC [Marinobacterium jannaschii]|uniref:class III poly(R)-hydroxyalkanoic acid synthase subunit PhaC n=1 Tax=Marinobacterium jannaschii TaxID=64970 RepID=UPI000489A02C|nr:class III poly(R)-hydroxyalkanoic acid synthase subunit PhaC [Marinobacterium jannaschii]